MPNSKQNVQASSGEVSLLDVEGLLTRQPGGVIKRRDWLEMESNISVTEVQGWLDQHGFVTRADSLGYTHRVLPVLDDVDFRTLATQLKRTFLDEDRTLAKWFFQVMREWNLTDGDIWNMQDFLDSGKFDDACLALVRFLGQYIADTSELIAAIFESLAITYIREWNNASQRMNTTFKFSYMNSYLQSLGAIPFSNQLYEIIKKRSAISVLTGPDGKVGVILPLFFPYGVDDYKQWGRHLKKMADGVDPATNLAAVGFKSMRIQDEVFEASSANDATLGSKYAYRYPGWGTFADEMILRGGMWRDAEPNSSGSGTHTVRVELAGYRSSDANANNVFDGHHLNQLWNYAKYITTGPDSERRDITNTVGTGQDADSAVAGILRSGLFAGMIATNLHRKVEQWREKYSNVLTEMRDPHSRLYQFFTGSVLHVIDTSLTFTKVSSDYKSVTPISADAEAASYRRYLDSALVPSHSQSAVIRRAMGGVTDPFYDAAGAWKTSGLAWNKSMPRMVGYRDTSWLSTLTQRAEAMQDYFSKLVTYLGSGSHVVEPDYSGSNGVYFLLRNLALWGVTKPFLFTNDTDERLKLQRWSETIRGSFQNTDSSSKVSDNVYHPITLDPAKWYIIGVEDELGRIPSVDSLRASNSEYDLANLGHDESIVETGLIEWLPADQVNASHYRKNFEAGLMPVMLQLLRQMSASLVQFVKDGADVSALYDNVSGDKGINYFLFEELAQGMIIPREVGAPKINNTDILQCGYWKLVFDEDVRESNAFNQKDDWAWFKSKGLKLGNPDLNVLTWTDQVRLLTDFFAADNFNAGYSDEGNLASASGGTQIFNRAFYGVSSLWVGDAFTRSVLDTFGRDDVYPLLHLYLERKPGDSNATAKLPLRILYGVPYPVKPYTDGIQVEPREYAYEWDEEGQYFDRTENTPVIYSVGTIVTDSASDLVISDPDSGKYGFRRRLRVAGHKHGWLDPFRRYAAIVPKLAWDLIRPLAVKTNNALGQMLSRSAPIYAASKFLDVSPASWVEAKAVAAAEIPTSALRLLKMTDFRKADSTGAPVGNERPIMRSNGGSNGRNRSGGSFSNRGGRGDRAGKSKARQSKGGGKAPARTFGGASGGNGSRDSSGMSAKTQSSEAPSFTTDAASTQVSSAPSKADKADDKLFKGKKVGLASAATAGMADGSGAST